VSERSGPAWGGHLALVGVQVCFGLFPVFGRRAMVAGEGFDPFAVAAWRITGGAVVLGLAALVAYGRRARPARAGLGRWVALALLGIVANQALYLSGLARSSAAEAALMMCTIPVFTFTAAVLVGQERFRPRRALGVAISLVGVLPLIGGGGGSLLGRHALGNGLMLANCLCYAFYLVLSKPLRRETPAVVLIAWNYLLSLPFVPLFLAGTSGLPARGGSAVWASLAYVVVFPTVVGYLLNLFALGRLRASTTALYVYLQPPIAALAGWWWLGERLRPAAGLAAASLFAGIWLVSRDERAARPQPLPRTP